MELETLQRFLIALALGFIVGLQREWVAHKVAGIRSFSLITVFGAISASASQSTGVWLTAAGLLALTAVIVQGRFLKAKDEEGAGGITTEVAALSMFVIGAGAMVAPIPLVLIAGGVVAALLQWKAPMHRFVERIGKKDMRAITQLTLIGLVILPALPNHAYGPYQVINPFEIWLMVVLICGISLGGYVAYKALGARAGSLLGGVLGGIISSTALTVSYARRTRHSPESAPLASFALMVASTIVFGRVIFEIGIVAPGILNVVIWPLGAMILGMVCLCFAQYYFIEIDKGEKIPIEDDPSELKSAIVFGLLYALVLLAVAAAKEHFGDSGLYAVAVMSGLTDMDAITLSTAQMINAGKVGVDTGWRMILVGSIANMFFKGSAIALLGHRRLFRRMALLFGVAMLFGLALVVFWPGAE